VEDSLMSRPAPTSLAELAADLGDDGVALLSAESAAELRTLLLGGGGPRRSTCVDAELLLRAHHTTAPGALDTARLLLTDRRWDRLTARLVRNLDGSGLLRDDELDALALELLTGEVLVYRVDDRPWAEAVMLPESDDESDSTDAGREHAADAVAEALVAHRRIPPPLRRWSAARAVRRSLTPLDALLDLVEALPARDAAEAVRGVVDELDALPPAAADALLETALTWPARAVRLAALERLTERGEAERAARLAAGDRDERIRLGFAGRDEQESLF
jgi:hypothetical protein